MASHSFNSPVIVFNHPEYGNRLLFQQGATNPRNELGKNGVTLHNSFTGLFYKTIRINAQFVDEYGTHEEQEFIINRNSLIKYLGSKEHSNETDDTLISKLNAIMWRSELNIPSPEDRERQNAAAELLRHAGSHNKKELNTWLSGIVDYIKGSFLSYLYQKTIGGINRIKLRFVFVSSEQDLFEAGKTLALIRFKEAYKHVPAYKNHISKNDELPVNGRFSDIPITNKENYIKNQKFDSDTHVKGRYPTQGKTDTSTGTTGKPTAWVRSETELETVKKSLKLASKIQFGDRKLNYINAFALGPWATGMTTYEIMRETGQVFATGPDKEKILDELLRIARYEEHQMDILIDSFEKNNPDIQEDHKTAIKSLINATLKELLKDRNHSVDKVFTEQFSCLEPVLKQKLTAHKQEILDITTQLSLEKSQTIIAGYPPFLKDLVAYMGNKGHKLSDFSLIGVVGGQGMSEAMREMLIKDGFNQIYSSYGASDLDINLGVETEYEIAVRKAIEKNHGLATELYGSNKGLPMIFHYDPMNYHVECLNDAENKNSLIFTCTREDRSSPRIRYDLGDKGRVYASSDVQALLTKYGIFTKPKTNLPLLFIWGRESTVVFNGANLDFTELERAITDTDTEGQVLKKAFYTYSDELSAAEKLEIWLELNDNIELPNPEDANKYAKTLISKLAELNQDFRYQVDKLENDTELLTVRYFKRNQSPISESSGHRKQVLVFKKENLPEKYSYPDKQNCCETCTKKSADILTDNQNKLEY